MNKKQMMKQIIGLSLLAGLFLPIVANADSYTVKSGDTLSAIAKEKNTTVDAIAKKNKISNVNLISVGQVLEIEDANTTQMQLLRNGLLKKSQVVVIQHKMANIMVVTN